MFLVDVSSVRAVDQVLQFALLKSIPLGHASTAVCGPVLCGKLLDPEDG
jgi:hypothetical protein